MDVIRALRAKLPEPLRQRLRSMRRWLSGTPGVGRTNFGDLRRLEPVSRHFGYDRGTPIDRRYVERFLQEACMDVKGRVLEVGDDTYTRKFGGARVTRSDVMHVHSGNPQATIVADLADAPHVPDAEFDAIILTQTLQLIFEAAAAVRTTHRILKPGGVLLLTVPGITCSDARGEWGPTWYWSFTELAVRRLLSSSFGEENVTTNVCGNVLAATAFLHGLAAEELSKDELNYADPSYPVTITARAVKVGNR